MVLSHKLENNIKWYYCDIDDCNYNSKNTGKIKRHKANIHNIDVKWHYCNLCSYKCKQKSSIKQHKSNIHNINILTKKGKERKRINDIKKCIKRYFEQNNNRMTENNDEIEQVQSNLVISSNSNTRLSRVEDNSNNSEELNVLDLFSGAGGFSYGFQTTFKFN